MKNRLGAFVQNLAYMWKSFSKLGQEDAVLAQEYVPGGDSQDNVKIGRDAETRSEEHDSDRLGSAPG